VYNDVSVVNFFFVTVTDVLNEAQKQKQQQHLHRGMKIVFLVLAFLHCVRVEFTGDVSGTTVVPTFTGHESFAL
jgi:CBS domain containing-hemolysin-like protein